MSSNLFINGLDNALSLAPLQFRKGLFWRHRALLFSGNISLRAAYAELTRISDTKPPKLLLVLDMYSLSETRHAKPSDGTCQAGILKGLLLILYMS